MGAGSFCFPPETAYLLAISGTPTADFQRLRLDEADLRTRRRHSAARRIAVGLAQVTDGEADKDQMDTLTVAERSERMARIRSKDTKPELRVRQLLHRLGYRFRLHRKDLPGSPDLVFPARRKAIFVHGCFWHAHEACRLANRPKSRRSFWDAKFERNKVRDAANLKALKQGGWKVYTVWECETISEGRLSLRLSKFLEPARTKMKRDRNGRK